MIECEEKGFMASTAATAAPSPPVNDAPINAQPAPQTSKVDARMPAANDAVYAEAANDPVYKREPHSQIASSLAPTSEFTRYMLVWLPSRYLGRAISDVVYKYFPHVPSFKKLADWHTGLLNKNIVTPIADDLNKVLRDSFSKELWQIAKSDASGFSTVENIGKKLASDHKSLYENFRTALEKHKFSFGHEDKEMIARAYDRATRNAPHAHTLEEMTKALEITPSGRDKLLSTVRTNLQHATYSRFLGISFLGLAVSYAYTVYKDLKHVFSETVALEKNVKPEDVSFMDIKRSDNKIIEKSASNFMWRTIERSVLSAPLFFVSRWMPRILPDAMVGAAGFKIFSETWNRKPTMFEDLVGFINNKINPQNGLGQPINTADIFDLYQHYCFHNAPDKAFNNVTEQNNREPRAWGQSQLLFSRIAELMNLSYAYKHTTKYDAEGKAIKQADFLLPKFIYLLGHDLINAMEPEKSLAYVEIANARGIAAVREAKAAFLQGASVKEVLAAHSIALPQLTAHATPEATTTNPKPLIAGGGNVLRQPLSAREPQAAVTG